MIRGNFIVLEGVDGAGTTTQASALAKSFEAAGLPAHVTAEPSSGPVGSIIRQVLTGRLAVRTSDASRAPSWRAMALLFAADRQDHLEAEILPNLQDGLTVICDRYLYSSVIYQSLSTNYDGAEAWIRELNRFAKKPDLVLYLKVSPKEALHRRQLRRHKEELFDDPTFQERLIHAYDEMATTFPDTRIVPIDCHRPIEEVTEACWTEIEVLRREGAPV
jgi:dTMP kinase